MPEPERCIILSSGRCGSTLLSNLIAADTESLSVQESLGGLLTAPWELGEELTGAQYWDLLSDAPLSWQVAVRIGAIAPEVRYPKDGRWAGNLSELPRICQVMLPVMFDDPDSWWSFLATRVPEFPVQTLAAQHRTLLDLLASLQNRRRWVERTGGSSGMTEPLLREFAVDKVVYLTRNAADTALSMSRHPAYQFGIIQGMWLSRCGFDPYQDAHAAGQRIPDELRPLLPGRLSLQALKDQGGDLEQHKLFYAYMSYAAERALDKNPPRRLLRMRYEDLVAAPVEQLTRLGDFLGFTDPAGWAARGAGQVR
jgi:putative sulfotransferase